MKRISCLFTLILSLSGGLLFSQPIIDCVDLVDDFSSAESPGIYGVSDVSLDYNGSNQIVTLGIYGFYSNQQEDQTFFSVNGSAPVSLETLGWSYTLGGVQIVRDQSQAWIDLENVYLSGASNSFNGRVYKFIGAVDNITMTQFESGVVYSCVEQLDDTSDCYYDFPGDEGNGYIVDSTYPFSFDGSDQTVEVGYFDYVWWGQQSSQWEGDRTYFSVNGSDMIMLDDIYYSPSTYVNGVSIYIDTTSIADEYLPQEGMISGRIVFIGEIDLIVTQQVESGIGFICTSPNVEQGDCQDFTYELDDPYAPGIYSLDGVPLEYDGQEQQVSLGIYGTFNEWLVADLWQAGETFFSVNGSDGVSLEEIYLNMPMQIGDVLVAVDTNSLVDTYGLTDEQGWTSGTILFTGAIEEIVMTQFESGLVFSCVEPIENQDCIDYAEDGVPPLGGTAEIAFDGTNQTVSIGILGSFNWDDLGGWGSAGDCYLVTVNGTEEPLTLSNIYENQPLQVGGITYSVDTLSLNDQYELPWLTAVTGTLIISGEIDQVELLQCEATTLFSCTEPSYSLPENCIDFVVDGVPQFGGFDTLYFNGIDQQVSLGFFGYYDWNDIDAPLTFPSETFVRVNNGELISIEDVYLNMPVLSEGVEISLDTNSLGANYGFVFGEGSGTLVFDGEVDVIEWTVIEGGLLFACGFPNEILEEDCEDYTVDGIPQFDQTPSLTFDGTHQEISVGIYGYYDWDDIYGPESFADTCFLSLNNGTQIAIDSLLNNMPLIYDGIEISLDTTSLNSEYNVPSYLGSGTLLFTGEITQIDFTFMEEAGLLFSCKSLIEDSLECGCDIDADFSHINLGSYFSFVSSGTGSEYSWDFGNGSTSEAESPSHYYETPGTYEVCMTNYNLTDTCSITICQSVEVTLETPGANIITPNGDGQDDLQELNCNDVTIYNRNGRVVARLQDQQYWDGRDSRGVLLPMGEYVLRCNENQVISKVTTIW